MCEIKDMSLSNMKTLPMYMKGNSRRLSFILIIDAKKYLDYLQTMYYFKTLLLFNYTDVINLNCDTHHFVCAGCPHIVNEF